MARSERATRSHRLGLLVVLLVVPVFAGCTAALPAEPFDTVTLSATGGVDGRDTVLTVEPDGTAVLLGPDPDVGTLSTDRMQRIEEIVTGEDFRTEAARDTPESSDRCSDQIVTTVEMGSLRMSRNSHCRPLTDLTPAFDELVSLLEINGELVDGPALQPMTITFGPDPEGTFALTEDGTWRAEVAGEKTQGSLASEEVDVVRVLQSRLVERGPGPEPADCPSGAGEQEFRLAGEEFHLGDCLPVRDDRELSALWALLVDAADLDG